MELEIVKYGHPVLRQKGTRVDPQAPGVQRLIADMIETMHAAAGVGLAAQQVAQALQLTVLDVREVKDRPSTLEIGGAPADVAEHMPMVLLNPQIVTSGPEVAGPEGCLSFPEVFADITRPESVAVKAQDEHGKPVEFRCGGLLARAIQHEYDHLQGILFIDRMAAETRRSLRPELEDLQAETKAELKARS